MALPQPHPPVSHLPRAPRARRAGLGGYQGGLRPRARGERTSRGVSPRVSLFTRSPGAGGGGGGRARVAPPRPAPPGPQAPIPGRLSPSLQIKAQPFPLPPAPSRRTGHPCPHPRLGEALSGSRPVPPHPRKPGLRPGVGSGPHGGDLKSWGVTLSPEGARGLRCAPPSPRPPAPGSSGSGERREGRRSPRATGRPGDSHSRSASQNSGARRASGSPSPGQRAKPAHARSQDCRVARSLALSPPLLLFFSFPAPSLLPSSP